MLLELLANPIHHPSHPLPQAAAGARPINLLPYMKRIPVKRVVHHTDLTEDSLAFKLAYNASTPHGLPPSVQSADIAWYKVGDRAAGLFHCKISALSGGITPLFDIGHAHRLQHR